MKFNRTEADKAANTLSLACDNLEEAGLTTLSTAVGDILDRLEAVLEGDTPMVGDYE